MKSKAGLMILAALSLIFAGQSRLVRYLAEEALTVLLSIAVFLTLTWIILAAFLLLLQGASLVLLQLKQIIRRGTSKADQPVAFHRRWPFTDKVNAKKAPWPAAAGPWPR